MKRRLLNTLTALSLLLCLAAAAMWVRSYLPDALWLRWVDGRVVLAGANNRTARSLSESYFDAPPGSAAGVRPLIAALRANISPFPRTVPRVPPRRFEALGFEAFDAVDPRTGKRECWLITVPGIYPVALTAVAPAAWLVTSLRRRRRARTGRCAQCGYDLRASPEKCPECGTSASPVRPETTPAVHPHAAAACGERSRTERSQA